MVESWRKVIPGLSMIKLTPHGVSQIRFCALDTVAAAYSTLSRIQSHLSRWHHSIAITVSERENASGQQARKRLKAMLSFLHAYLSFTCLWFLRSISINRGACSYLFFCGQIKNQHIEVKFSMLFLLFNFLIYFFIYFTSINLIVIYLTWKYIQISCHPASTKLTASMAVIQKVFIFTVICGLKEQLPEHLLSRSELPETILMFAVAQRSGVHGLWHIYYLHNSDTDSIYFLFVPSNVPRFFCQDMCFPSKRNCLIVLDILIYADVNFNAIRGTLKLVRLLDEWVTY